MNKKKWMPILFTGMAVCAYGLIGGIGFFNKPRFRAQHEAVRKYLESRHFGASYSPIKMTDNGWYTVVTDTDGRRYHLYMTCTKDGMFLFNETAI